MARTHTLLVCSMLVAAARAAAAETPRAALERPIARSAEAEVRRLLALESTGHGLAGAQAPRRSSWIQRHPVKSAAIAGGIGGFAVGIAAGDDGVFDDYTGGFNGVVLGGLCAGAGAAMVAVIQAIRD